MILGTGHAIVQRHQDVGRLDVAVDDALLVRMLDRVADQDEQFQPLRVVAGCCRRSTP